MIDDDESESYDTPSLAAIANELQKRNVMVDRSLGDLHAANIKAAEAEHDYRMARARAYVQLVAECQSKPESKKPTVDHLNALADLAVADVRFNAKLKEAEKEAALESARSRRGQLSAVQTLANAIRAEIEFVRQGGGG